MKFNAKRGQVEKGEDNKSDATLEETKEGLSKGQF